MSVRILLPAFLLAVTLAFAAASSAKAEPTPGWKAFTSSNHEKAEAIWRPLAEQGDHHAAFGMGVLAQTRNQHEAPLTERAGRGVAWDAVRAYAWLHRATLDGHANAARARDAVGAALTPDQLSQAEALSLTLRAPE